MADTQRRTEVKTLPINGTELHYAEQGEGESVLFIHGGLADFRTWLPQLKTFGSRYRAVTYSRRAHYPNEWPAGYDARMQTHVDDLAALIERLNIGPAHLVGNSYGSYVALVLALQHPPLVRSLSLAEPPVHPLLETLPAGKPLLDSFMAQSWLPSRGAFQAGDIEEGMRLFVNGAVGPGEWEKLSPRTRLEMMKDAPELAVSAGVDFHTHMLPLTCDDLSRIQAPTLLMRGANSPPMYIVINNELARCIPNARQATIPNAAHILHAHNPEEHDRAVLGFIADEGR